MRCIGVKTRTATEEFTFTILGGRSDMLQMTRTIVASQRAVSNTVWQSHASNVVYRSANKQCDVVYIGLVSAFHTIVDDAILRFVSPAGVVYANDE